MDVIEGRTVQDGDRVWVELPAEFGIAGDMPIRMHGSAGGVTIRPNPVFDPIEEKRKLDDLIAALRALGPALPHQPREPFEFPERSGL